MAVSFAWAIVVLGLKFVLILFLARLSTRSHRPHRSSDADCVQIVVLGDIGRTPRMQYHALSFADAGFLVYLIGYTTSKLHPDIFERDNIKVVSLKPFPKSLNTQHPGLFLFLGPLKVLYQAWILTQALIWRKTTNAGWMLVQNPPAIPTLAVSAISSWMQQTRLVIDWHNLGFSILALKLGQSHPLVMVSKLYEKVFGRFAYAHICVTDAMKRFICEEFGIYDRVFKLCDRPAALFQPIGRSERHEFLATLCDNPGINTLRSSVISAGSIPPGLHQDTIAALQRGTSRLIISPTSWTADEDFGLLLQALTDYDRTCGSSESQNLPDLVVMITGKGPDREHFESRVRQVYQVGGLPHVEIVTTFFEDVRDYAKALASADLGVSLHTSSSGIDLPMKVLDMFGAALPVLGWSNFEAWSELVREGDNGLGFEDARGLQRTFEATLAADSQILSRLKRGAAGEGKRRWNDEWQPISKMIFQSSP